MSLIFVFFFFSSRRRHTRLQGDWSSDVCSSDLLGLSAAGLGVAVTLTLAGSAALTWLVRRPAERYGARAALLALGALSAVAAVIFLSSRDPRLVVLAAILGHVAVGTGETGPFLTPEQGRIAPAVPARR